jgi:MFS family permease
VLAGFAMAAMSVGWPLASSQAAKLYLRIDFRDTAMIGSVFTIAGCVMFALFVQEDSGLWRVALSSFVVGVGLGFASIAILVAVQSVVGWNRRGVVTGANMFMRSLGSAVGVAVFGSIANTTLASQLGHPPANLAGRVPHSVDSASIAFSGHSDPAVHAYIRHSLYLATHRIFWALVVAAVIGLLTQLLLPRRVQPLVFPDDPPVQA